MIYDMTTRELMTDKRKLLKKLDCPLHKKWQDLTVLNGGISTHRHCDSCQKNVMDIGGFTDEEALAFFQTNPRACVYVGSGHENIRHRRGYTKEKPTELKPCVCREIQTARGEEAITKAVEEGYFPLVKRVEMPEKFQRRMNVFQNKKTGEVRVIGLVHLGLFMNDLYPKGKPDWEEILPRFAYYPSPPQEPIAAYLIPKNLQVGETVLLVDLIEDLIKAHIDDDLSRLSSAYATWTGEDFQILWDEKRDADHITVG
jgi:hypothetical protein